MGLFGKKGPQSPKHCAVCRRRLGAADTLCLELADGCLCNKCRKITSDFLSTEKISGKWTAADVKAHYLNMKQQEKMLTEEFIETDFVRDSDSGDHAGQKLLRVDSAHGWFNVCGTPEIFDFAQVTDYHLSFMCSHLDAHVPRHLPFTAPRAGMAVPGSADTLISLQVEIHLKDHPYADVVTIHIASSGARAAEPYHTFLTNVYGTAADIYDLLARETRIQPAEPDCVQLHRSV